MGKVAEVRVRGSDPRSFKPRRRTLKGLLLRHNCFFLADGVREKKDLGCLCGSVADQ
jgi:hypothetical protein